MDTLTARVTDAKGFFHDMLLPAINVPGLGRHLFSGGTTRHKGINTVSAKESYLDAGQFKISLCNDKECPTIDYLDLELAPGGNYQTKGAFPTGVISEYTIPAGSALASRLLRNGAMGAVAPLVTAARSFIAVPLAAPGLSTLHTRVSAHGARLTSGSTMGAASISTATTSFTAPAITPGLATATTTTTPAMATIAMVPAGSEQLPPAPGTCERGHLSPAPRASERAHHAARAEHSQDGSQFHRLADRVRHLQDQNGTKQPIRNEPGRTKIA